MHACCHSLRSSCVQFFLITVGALFLACSSSAVADIAWLNNGDILSGKISELTDGRILFVTDWGGEIAIALKQVKSLETDQMLWIRIKGQDTFRLVKLRSDYPHTLLVADDGTQSRLASYDQISVLKADRKKAHNWLWSGEVNTSLSWKFGDEDEGELTAYGAVHVRNRQHRNSLRWQSELSKEDGAINDKALRLTYSYNHFLDRHWYLLANGLTVHDSTESPFARYTGSGGLGYQLWDRAEGTLRTDVGLGHLWELFDDRDRLDRWIVRWGVSGAWQATKRVSATFESSVFYRIGDRNHLLWDADIGFRYRLTNRLWLNLKHSRDWDSAPVDRRSRTQAKVIFGVGYGW